MIKIVYSQDYKEKLELIRDWLDLRFGKDTRIKRMTEIKKRLTSLKEFPTQGMSVRAMFGVDSDYEFIYVSHNYIFYYFPQYFIPWGTNSGQPGWRQGAFGLVGSVYP